MFTISVGSKNPVKINATKDAAHKLWEGVQVIGLKTISGISSMPISKVETRIGAKNRANFAYKNSTCKLAVAHEGGVFFLDNDWYLFATSVSTDGKKYYWGGEIQLALPKSIAVKLKNGSRELGDIMDELLNTTNSKQKGGAIDYLTNGRVTRQEAFEFCTLLCLSPWINQI